MLRWRHRTRPRATEASPSVTAPWSISRRASEPETPNSAAISARQVQLTPRPPRSSPPRSAPAPRARQTRDRTAAPPPPRPRASAATRPDLARASASPRAPPPPVARRRIVRRSRAKIDSRRRARVRRTVAASRDIVRRIVEQQPPILRDRLVRDRHRLAVHLLRPIGDPIWLPSDFDIFLRPSMPTSSGIVRIDCSRLPYARWMSRPSSRLNFWSVPPSSTSASTATES